MAKNRHFFISFLLLNRKQKICPAKISSQVVATEKAQKGQRNPKKSNIFTNNCYPHLIGQKTGKLSGCEQKIFKFFSDLILQDEGFTF